MSVKYKYCKKLKKEISAQMAREARIKKAKKEEAQA